MTENEFLLQDRLNAIRDTVKKYGEENFYISFSGGKDSTVVHYLIDMALPDNRIPRVFINTGIEYNAIVEFVRERERGQQICFDSAEEEHKKDLRSGWLSIQVERAFSEGYGISKDKTAHPSFTEIFGQK